MRNGVAVTGVTGYVGKHVRALLHTMGIPVVCITQKRVSAYPNEKVLSFESCSRLSSLRTLSKCASMIHLAGVGRHQGGDGYWQNVALAQSATSVCLRAGISRMVFVSGLGADSANTGYFASKLASERAIISSGISYMIFRASYIVGRGDALVTKIRRLARQGLPVIPGDGKYVIQPIHIDDASVALVGQAILSARTRRILDLVGPSSITYEKFASIVLGRKATRYPLPVALRNAVLDRRASYDIDELAILYGSFVGNHEKLARVTKIDYADVSTMKL